MNIAPEINYKNMTEFNQVFEQYLQVDPACFRVKRFDLVHVAFKIKYLNELVQGLSGPYRQFFSDIVIELENSDITLIKRENIKISILSIQKVKNFPSLNF